MSNREMKELRRVLAEAVKATRLTRRELERALGLGSGNLSRWEDGTLEIRLRHLLGLAAVLNVPPADFLELGFPELHRNARYRLADWLGPNEPPRKRKSGKDLPTTAEELKELIREVMREEKKGGGGGTS